MISISRIVLVMVAVLLSAAAYADAPADMNEWCPIMPEDRAKPQYYADHDGARIYFCCGRCRGRFERNPEGFPEALALAEERAEASPHAHDKAHDADEPHAVHDHHDHDHGVEHPLLNWLGKHHPFVVHFPIAFLLVAAGVELVRLRRDRLALADIARFCVWIGAVSAVIATVLGWFFGGFRIVDDNWVMTAHRWIGTAVALSALVTLFFCERQGARGTVYRATLFVTALLVGAAGFLGGSLIYGIDHLMW